MKWLIGLLMLSSVHQAWSVDVRKIELFLNSDMSVQNERFARDIEFEVIYLDQVKMLEKSISQQLPKDPDKAQQVAKRLINDSEFTSAMGVAYQGQLKAWRYGIKHLPAAVINDGQGLIYGSSDVAELLSRVEQQ
ncbi:TIGR03757 family integrating conjugative element protein [Thiomicrospira sp.]|uniref:TIGR03757 family integrating conjugative element protein n=1 Tax=Thiomicrospira sp. TaxID=935 RepID=UPI002F92E4BB